MVRGLELAWVAGFWSGWEREGRERKFFVSMECDFAYAKNNFFILSNLKNT
jgi:hypothetical protein